VPRRNNNIRQDPLRYPQMEFLLRIATHVDAPAAYALLTYQSNMKRRVIAVAFSFRQLKYFVATAEARYPRRPSS
jgi:hypothetical protein